MFTVVNFNPPVLSTTKAQIPMGGVDETGDGCALVKFLGSGAVAEHLDELPSTVSNWIRRGVPRAKRHAVAEYARARGVPVPEGFLPPPRRRVSPCPNGARR